MTPTDKICEAQKLVSNTRLSHVIRFCGIITLGPTFQKNFFFVPGFLKRPAKPEETRRFFSQKKLDAIVGIAAQALGTALERKPKTSSRVSKGKITKRLRRTP